MFEYDQECERNMYEVQNHYIHITIYVKTQNY